MNKPNDDGISSADDQGLGLDRSDYNAEDLKFLNDLEHVRARPGMYIGDTTLKGLHHLVYEVVDNSIDEAMADFAKQKEMKGEAFLIKDFLDSIGEMGCIPLSLEQWQMTGKVMRK